MTTLPDPRLVESWCGRGAGHRHDECGNRWNPSDPADRDGAIAALDAGRYRTEPDHTAVDLADIVGIAELAREFNTSRAAVSNWPTRYPDFPAPLKPLAAGPLYSLAAVRAWRDTPRQRHNRYATSMPCHVNCSHCHVNATT